jgi:hypothetical protein
MFSNHRMHKGRLASTGRRRKNEEFSLLHCHQTLLDILNLLAHLLYQHFQIHRCSSCFCVG